MRKNTCGYCARLWVGRVLLAESVVLYGLSLLLRTVVSDETAGWRLLWGCVIGLVDALKRGSSVECVYIAAVLNANLLVLAVFLALALGWVRFSRVAGALSLLNISGLVAFMVVESMPTPAHMVEVMGQFHGAWLWLASLHLATAAAFTMPRRPRQPDAD